MPVGGGSHSEAYKFYVSVDGSAQGAFKGAAEGGRIPAIRFSYEIVAGTAPTGAGAAGRRSLEPVTITKEWDAASPQFFHAAITNEMLKSVLFEFARVLPTGQSEVGYTVKLTNAVVSSYKQYTDLLPEGGASTFELEDVSFTFQKIDVAHADGTKATGTSAGGRGSAGWDISQSKPEAIVRAPARLGPTGAGQ